MTKKPIHVFLHSRHISTTGSKKITIKIVYTDVLILSTSIFHKLKDHLDELWIDFGIGKNRRFFPVREIYQHLGGRESTSITIFFKSLQAATRCLLCLLLAEILHGKLVFFLMKLPQFL